MKRTAIAVYIDDNPDIICEFGWLFRSWMRSCSDRTSDIVAFYNPTIKVESLPKNSGITYIPLKPLTELDSGWSDYKFINSVHFLTTPEASVLTDYEYVLRTDCDCFLTPYFGDFKPRLATFGIGLYSLVPEVSIKLVEIAGKWGVSTILSNIGATLMAPSWQVLQYSQLHMEYCRKLRAEEFSGGHGSWPGWFFGVLTMYAGQIAANAYFQASMVQGGVDIHCMSQDKMCQNDYHIHAFHTYDMFSKFRWREGFYEDWDFSKLDENVISNYCLLIAGKKQCV